MAAGTICVEQRSCCAKRHVNFACCPSIATCIDSSRQQRSCGAERHDYTIDSTNLDPDNLDHTSNGHDSTILDAIRNTNIGPFDSTIFIYTTVVGPDRTDCIDAAAIVIDSVD